MALLPAIYLLAAVLGAGSVGAVRANDQAAIATAEAYSRALVNGDCATMESLSSESVRRRIGGGEKLREFLCRLIASIGIHNDNFDEVLLGVSGRFRDGATELVFVRNKRILHDSYFAATVTDGTYVIYSSDRGFTWQVLDLACIDERWLREIAPHYNGDPPISPATAYRVE